MFKNLSLDISTTYSYVADYGNGDETRYFPALHVYGRDSEEDGTLTFEEVGKCLFTSAGGPALEAKFIVFIVGGEPVQPSYYGLTLDSVSDGSGTDYCFFVDGNGDPLSVVTIE
jgi:hypothetical protein